MLTPRLRNAVPALTARAVPLLAVPLLAVPLLVACAGKDTSATGDSASARTTQVTVQACAGDNAGLTLPKGFCVTAFADSVKHGRHVAVASNGDVYITIEGTQPKGNASSATAPKPSSTANASVIALRDTNHDGAADIVARIGTLGNTGVRVVPGYLYVDEGARIVRYARADSALVPAGSAEVVVDGIPMLPGHRARSFAIGSDNALYLVVGSATNNCQQKDRMAGSKGIDPCSELEQRAGIWKYDAKGTGQHFAASDRFATGIRNGMGIEIGPDGQLYTTQHGRDQLHDNWPDVFPAVAYQASNPGEELLQVSKGDDFGWPYCYYAMDEKKLVDAPEYGGDGKRTTRCTTRKAPVAVFPAHWAPMALLFAQATGPFPEHYRSGAFIAFHGSWNRAPEPQGGYQVVFQPMRDGKPTGDFETFADGFSGKGTDVQPDNAMHRPAGLAFAPDGAMFITDDAGGRVYRVTYMP